MRGKVGSRTQLYGDVCLITKVRKKEAMLKKVTLGLIAALGVSASALAAGPGADVPIPAAPASINVTSPVQHGSWEIGLEAGYYQPANENFQYAQQFVGGDEWKDYDVRPTHQWAGHADVTFRTPGPGGFVQLGATHFSANDSDHESVISNGILNSPFNQLSSFSSKLSLGTDYESAKGSVEDKYTDVDLVFGRTFDVGALTRFNMYGGLRYASIDNDTKGTYKNSNGSVLTGVDVVRLDSDFSGVGLRGGISTEVNLAYGFSFVGNFAGSLLAGNGEQKLTGASVVYGSSGTISATDSVEIRDSDDTRVIPELDARVGLHYNYGFNPTTSVGLEIGYQIENYFSVVDKDLVDAALPNTIHNNNDFGFQGPYFRAQVNIA